MKFREFPKLKGPPPILLAFLVLAACQAALFFWPTTNVFLGVNLLSVFLVLMVIAVGQRYIPRVEQNFILVANLLVVLGLYGFYRGFDKAEIYLLEIFQVFPALVFYFALRLLRSHYAIKKALSFSKTMIPEERLDYADQARQKFKKYPGALEAAARIYKDLADEGLGASHQVLPLHIAAMQKYGEMLLHDEARGRSGEAEWYAKKASELSMAMLKDSETPPTFH